jgi:hypothetical protein
MPRRRTRLRDRLIEFSKKCPAAKDRAKRKSTMNYMHAQNHVCNHYLDHAHEEASWPEIVDLIFSIVAHQDRLAVKRKALGRRKRKLARRKHAVTG